MCGCSHTHLCVCPWACVCVCTRVLYVCISMPSRPHIESLWKHTSNIKPSGVCKRLSWRALGNIRTIHATLALTFSAKPNRPARRISITRSSVYTRLAELRDTSPWAEVLCGDTTGYQNLQRSPMFIDILVILTDLPLSVCLTLFACVKQFLKVEECTWILLRGFSFITRQM